MPGGLDRWVLDMGGPLFLCLLAAFFLVGLTRGLVANLRQRARVVRVPGVVVDLRSEVTTGRTTQRDVSYAPVLEFRTVDGRVVQTQSQVHSNPPVGQPGQQVRVAYDRTDPTDAWVDTVAGSGLFLYLGGIPLAAVGFVVGLLLLL